MLLDDVTDTIIDFYLGYCAKRTDL